MNNNQKQPGNVVSLMEYKQIKNKKTLGDCKRLQYEIGNLPSFVDLFEELLKI